MTEKDFATLCFTIVLFFVILSCESYHKTKVCSHACGDNAACFQECKK